MTRYQLEVLIQKEQLRLGSTAADVRREYRATQPQRTLVGEDPEHPSFMQIILGLIHTTPSDQPWEDEEDGPPPFPASLANCLPSCGTDEEDTEDP